MAAARCQHERDRMQCQCSPALGQVSAALPPALGFLHEITEEFCLTEGGGDYDEKTRYAELSPSSWKMFISKTEH